MNLAEGQCPDCRWGREFLTPARIKRCWACKERFETAAIETISTVDQLDLDLYRHRRAYNPVEFFSPTITDTEKDYLLCATCLKPWAKLPSEHGPKNCSSWCAEMRRKGFAIVRLIAGCGDARPRSADGRFR